MTSLVTCRNYWLKSDLCLVTINIFVIAEVFVLYAGFRCRYRAGHDNIVVLIGGIHIAMLTVLSVTLAVGAQQLAKYKATVTRITAIEEFAGVPIPWSELQPPTSSPSTASPIQTLLAANASRKKNEDAINTSVVQTLRDTARARAGVKLLDFPSSVPRSHIP